MSWQPNYHEFFASRVKTAINDKLTTTTKQVVGYAGYLFCTAGPFIVVEQDNGMMINDVGGIIHCIVLPLIITHAHVLICSNSTTLEQYNIQPGCPYSDNLLPSNAKSRLRRPAQIPDDGISKRTMVQKNINKP
ncbi:hypothetical protein PABG_01149 [Paracoccidioides brasiliensis Pb03]|nr:hypothetical protein PABG_01149 [Paracoccidioides brasiliensis Pb03]